MNWIYNNLKYIINQFKYINNIKKWITNQTLLNKNNNNNKTTSLKCNNYFIDYNKNSLDFCINPKNLHNIHKNNNNKIYV